MIVIPQCDYVHDGGSVPAAWMFVGEAGDYYVCDHHFQMRTPDGQRGWTPVAEANPT